MLDKDAVYRCLNKLNIKLKEQVERIAFTHTLKVLDGKISIVFYDMTMLYFEASDEDDLRKAAFTAYSIYKELERILYKEKLNLSVRKAAQLTHNMYQITYTLPESKHT